MSDRGHWTTELVWCKSCADVLSDYFIGSDDWPYAAACMPTLDSGKYWLFAGLVQGLYAGEEVHIFEGEVTDELQEQLCHTVTFWVFAEAYDTPCTVTVSPKHTGMAVDG